jgi:predicted regulator of Ras-like GTPase activity (Roadblock/LC7/MglB family)
MRNRWLSEITEITGVEGVMLVTAEGDVIEKLGTPDDIYILERIARHSMRMSAAFRVLGNDVREIELVWQNYRLLVMNAGPFALIIFCGSLRAISLLRITLIVVIAHLSEDKKIMKKINKHSARGERLLKTTDLDQMEINLISKLQ